jgi:thiol-disulfide isomerase/thioredoxin
MAKSKCLPFNMVNIVLGIVLLSLMFSCVLYGCSLYKKEGMSNGKEFVLVHMNGCGHCKTLMPEWDAANAENNTGVTMRKVEMNEDDGPELCKKHNIKGFPTMMVLDNGNKVADYDGERNKNGILSFLKNL